MRNPTLTYPSISNTPRGRASVWVQEGFPDALARRLTEHLRSVGLDLAEPGEPTPCIVLFQSVGDELLTELASISRSASGRVIAIAASQEGTPRVPLWDVARAGASDAFVWADDEGSADHVAARIQRWETVDRIIEGLGLRRRIVGSAPSFLTLLGQVVEVASFSRTPILVTGETGTGKELIARLVHELDPKAAGQAPVVVDCTTIVPELSGSEFFGHKRGAFTNAFGDRDGAFALADGGLLFLDEVGELPLTMQGEILRAIQEKTYKRVGDNVWRKSDFRLVSATNADLDELVTTGRFRKDLFYRIASWQCELPSLNERREDIPALVAHFLEEALGGKAPRVDPLVMDVLVARPYPGNIRELRHLVSRILVRHTGRGPITLGDLPQRERRLVGPGLDPWHHAQFRHTIRRALASGYGLKEIQSAAGEIAVDIALEESDGSVSEAAERLSVTPRALQLRRARKDGPIQALPPTH